MKEGDIVRASTFGGTEGVLVEILNLPWGFTHKIKVTKGNPFYEVGSILECKPEQLTLIDKQYTCAK